MSLNMSCLSLLSRYRSVFSNYVKQSPERVFILGMVMASVDEGR